MKTHTNVTPENKSSAVANEVSTKQNDCASAFYFVDNRPEAITQRKLQEIVNNSPRVNPQPIQLKKVAKDQLNVVGEDHEDSKLYRNGEKFVASNEAEGGYWGENEFWFFKDEADADGKDWDWGDSRVLLIKQSMGILAQTGHSAASLLSIYSMQRESGNLQEDKEDENAYGILGECQEMLGNYRDNPDKEAEVKQLLEASLFFKGVDAFIEKVTRLKVLMETYLETRNFSEQVEVEVKDILGDIAPRHLNIKNVAKERSDFMLMAANKASDVRGIWKIGEHHIPDLTESKEQKKFEILTEGEFYTEYGEMIRGNNEPVPEAEAETEAQPETEIKE